MLLRLKGWGRFSINIINNGSIEVTWQDSIWSEVGLGENSPVDDFIVGALAEAASITFGGNWRFTEVQCRSLGAPSCKFAGVIST